MINIEDKLCTGCTMCGQICPMHAISFEIRDGFRFPVVDMDSCIECHLCEKSVQRLGNIFQRIRIQSFIRHGLKTMSREISVHPGAFVTRFQKELLKMVAMYVA